MRARHTGELHYDAHAVEIEGARLLTRRMPGNVDTVHRSRAVRREWRDRAGPVGGGAGIDRLEPALYRELFHSFEQGFGYDTRVVHDGPTALAEAERFNPQLALVDPGPPVMDWFELALRFAEHPRLRETKLIAVTGYGQARDRETSVRVGSAAHLVKPVDLDELRFVLGAVATR